MANEPVHVVRFGLILCEVFRRETRSGERFNVSLSRLYRNNSTWVRSRVLGRDDIQLACKALDGAHSWIFNHSQSSPQLAPQRDDAR